MLEGASRPTAGELPPVLVLLVVLRLGGIASRTAASIAATLAVLLLLTLAGGGNRTPGSCAPDLGPGRASLGTPVSKRTSQGRHNHRDVCGRKKGLRSRPEQEADEPWSNGQGSCSTHSCQPCGDSGPVSAMKFSTKFSSPPALDRIALRDVPPKLPRSLLSLSVASATPT